MKITDRLAYAAVDVAHAAPNKQQSEINKLRKIADEYVLERNTEVSMLQDKIVELQQDKQRLDFLLSYGNSVVIVNEQQIEQHGGLEFIDFTTFERYKYRSEIDDAKKEDTAWRCPSFD